MILGLSVIVLTNVVALIGVRSNRSGPPVQVVEFSQDELRMIETEKDDSSIRLRLNSGFESAPDGTQRGFDRAKLIEIGFDLPPTADSARNVSPVPREAFIAFRFRQEGEDVAEAAQRLGSPGGAPVAEPRVPRSPASRLVVVDAARSYEELRRRYPDAQKNPIVPGVVYAHPLRVTGEHEAAGSAQVPWQGHVSTLIPPEIHVPRPHSARLAPLKQTSPELRKYHVTLHYGKRFEPWVAAVELP
jgi:hypothetical protein